MNGSLTFQEGTKRLIEVINIRYEDEAKEIVGTCNAVFRHDNTKREKEELIKKIAIKIDQIISDECSECEYMIQAEDRPSEPIYDPNDLD